MSLTKTKLCNLALSKLGSERILLSDFDTDTGVLRDTLDLHYTPTLEELVRMHKWNCCKAREKLTNSTTTSPKAPLFQFKEQHNLPSDYIRATYVTNSDETYEYGKPVVDYAIEGGKLLSHHKEIWLCYIKQPSPSEMDSMFAQAFVTLLASRIATTVTGDRGLSLNLMEEFNRVVMPEARRVNAMEKREAPEIDSEWLDSTYTSGSSFSNSYPPFSQTSYGSFI